MSGKAEFIGTMKCFLMYECIYSDTFRQDIDSFKREKKAIVRKIDAAIKKLSFDPYRNSKLLEGKYKGKRSHRKGKLRIIFVICEECRKLNHISLNNCPNCDDFLDKTLIFLKVGRRKSVYR